VKTDSQRLGRKSAMVAGWWWELWCGDLVGGVVS
jgi:hypothetical protein